MVELAAMVTFSRPMWFLKCCFFFFFVVCVVTTQTLGPVFSVRDSFACCWCHCV